MTTSSGGSFSDHPTQMFLATTLGVHRSALRYTATYAEPICRGSKMNAAGSMSAPPGYRQARQNTSSQMMTSAAAPNVAATTVPMMFARVGNPARRANATSMLLAIAPRSWCGSYDVTRCSSGMGTLCRKQSFALVYGRRLAHGEDQSSSPGFRTSSTPADRGSIHDILLPSTWKLIQLTSKPNSLNDL
jgi:hypothetical protein